ncbi:hypothetical protein FRB99_000602 [Tulasnella sp. 403]|nr:hypothetical protein FRB99_000602 [Tulasnella sp. 403]
MKNLKPVRFSHACDIFVGTSSSVPAVALKRVRITDQGYTESQKTDIIREGKVWQTLKHHHILEFLGTGEDDKGNLYLASPWMQNGSLVDYIPRHPDCDRAKFLRETAEALVYLHSVNTIHGDVKASNILVADDTRVVMCDFGLARLSAASTAPGLKGAGTVRWQSPELWEEASKSYASDVYAFGMTIYEVLTGKEPFYDCKEYGTLLTRVIKENQRPPRGPEESPNGESYSYLWDTAERCWKKDRDERPSMADVLRWLQNGRVDPEQVEQNPEVELDA